MIRCGDCWFHRRAAIASDGSRSPAMWWTATWLPDGRASASADTMPAASGVSSMNASTKKSTTAIGWLKSSVARAPAMIAPGSRRPTGT